MVSLVLPRIEKLGGADYQMGLGFPSVTLWPIAFPTQAELSVSAPLPFVHNGLGRIHVISYKPYFWLSLVYTRRLGPVACPSEALFTSCSIG